MGAKAYLESIDDMYSAYLIALEKEQKFREQLLAPKALTYDKDQIMHSVEDTMTEQMARLADYSMERQRRLNRYMDAVDRLEGYLLQIENTDLRMIIWCRYVLDMGFKDLSTRLGLSTERVKHKIPDAYAALEAVMRKNRHQTTPNDTK